MQWIVGGGRRKGRDIPRRLPTSTAEEMRANGSDNEFQRLLSPEEIAHLCGLSRRAVYRAIARGELRAARLCHRLRVQPAELERWIGEQTLSPVSPLSRRTRRPTQNAQRGSLRVMLDEAGEGRGKPQ